MQSNLNKYSKDDVLVNTRRPGLKFKVLGTYEDYKGVLLYSMYSYYKDVHFTIICTDLDNKEYVKLSIKNLLKQL